MEYNEVIFDEFTADDFVEGVLDDVLSLDDEGITLHGPNGCLELASTEDYFLSELQEYFSLLRENLKDMLENVIAAVESVYEESEEEPKEPKGFIVQDLTWNRPCLKYHREGWLGEEACMGKPTVFSTVEEAAAAIRATAEFEGGNKYAWSKNTYAVVPYPKEGQ
jgi:hypothetical protein